MLGRQPSVVTLGEGAWLFSVLFCSVLGYFRLKHIKSPPPPPLLLFAAAVRRMCSLSVSQRVSFAGNAPPSAPGKLEMATPNVPTRVFFEEHLRASQAARERFLQPEPPLSVPEPPLSVPEPPLSVPEPPLPVAPPPAYTAPELTSAALCPSCGNCTRHNLCEGCGTNMAEALALWRSTGITAEGLAARQPAHEASVQGADEDGAPAVLDAPQLPDIGGLDEVAGIFSMLQTDGIAPAAAPDTAASSPAATPPEVVDSFPVTVLSQDGPECPICLLAPPVGESVLILPCFHVYHQECITRWLQLKRSCPVCKLDVVQGTCPPPTPEQMGNGIDTWQGS